MNALSLVLRATFSERIQFVFTLRSYDLTTLPLLRNFRSVFDDSKFFTTFRDIPFWIHSLRTDSLLKTLRRTYDNEQAFDHLYRFLHDPWLAAVPYYRYQPLKYRVMLSLLPPRPYLRALDIGCGLGIFSRLLAGQCRQVVGIDISQHAVDSAARASAAVPNVQFRKADLLKLDSFSLGQFDLLVLADTIYYLPDLSQQWLQLAGEQIVRSLAPGGIFMLVNHYVLQLDPHSRMMRTVHNYFCATKGLRFECEYRRPFYLVSVLERTH